MSDVLNRLAARGALVRAAMELHDVLMDENCRVVSTTYERPSERCRRAQQEFARSVNRYRELGGNGAEDGYRTMELFSRRDGENDATHLE